MLREVGGGISLTASTPRLPDDLCAILNPGAGMALESIPFMNSRYLFVPVLALVAATGFAQTAATWKPFVAKQGRFKVEVPGTPKYSKSDAGTPKQPLAMHSYSYEDKLTAYVVIYSDHPEGAKHKVTPQDLLKSARQGLLEDVKPDKISSERKISVQKRPGLEVKYVDTDGDTWKVRLVVSNYRLFQVMTITSDDTAERASVDRFLNSFQFVAPK